MPSGRLLRLTVCPNIDKFYFKQIKQGLQPVMPHTTSKELRVTTSKYIGQEKQAHPLAEPRVPLKIWDLWDRGVKNAPQLQKTCLMSHRGANPTFTVTQLDMKGLKLHIYSQFYCPCSMRSYAHIETKLITRVVYLNSTHKIFLRRS